MRTIFIGTYVDSTLIENINGKSDNSSQISVAAIKYSKLIAEGLDYNSSSNINLFLAPLGMFPSCKLIFFYHQKQSNNYFIPFINIFLLKQASIAIYCLFFLTIWYLKNIKHQKYVFLGFLYLPFLIASYPFKVLPNIKFVSFIPDLPEFSFTYTNTKSVAKKILIPIYIWWTTVMSSCIDHFVFITKHMTRFFPNKPYFIIEGFTDFNLLVSLKEENYVSNKKAIMYAGALFDKFGVNTLVDAFMGIPGEFELWLFGYGDLIETIIYKSKIDPRIKFFGNISNHEVFEFEKKSRLLVNPRPLNHEFTKYSFPSKLLEYMSSGTPVLTTKLECIPSDYFDKLYFFKDDSLLEIRKSLIEKLLLSDHELNNMGDSAKSFILNEKNNYKLIADLITNLNSFYLNNA
ncbi:glycosyltransferase [Aquirufa antheringensis]|uniref:glycosyltransferase n=1 Tax=Aquirufa antheringensis TaxID=2516559 RepID=UPI0022A8F11F|nr:glycosyltransferase [Aquirufa antheringensis]MCZ2484740.1 glycosyltransferase [Aquirufa antheringensis]